MLAYVTNHLGTLDAGASLSVNRRKHTSPFMVYYAEFGHAISNTERICGVPKQGAWHPSFMLGSVAAPLEQIFPLGGIGPIVPNVVAL